MNKAEQTSCALIESTLGEHKAFRKVEDKMYVIKQGSSYVMINVVPWGEQGAVVRCVSQLVKGVSMTERLAVYLLRLNAVFRFGAFAYSREGDLVVFLHSILGGDTLDPSELLATVRDVALIADEWDDKIIEHYGGQRMQDLLEEAALSQILTSEQPKPGWDEN
jgi:hypothetical protein